MTAATGFAGRYDAGVEPEAVEAKLRRLRRFANFLDTAVALPGGLRAGADSIIGLLPIGGDVATALIACYFVYEGKKLGLPKRALAAMAGNVVLDLVLGATPILGNLADTIFKANIRNMAIIEKHVGRRRV